MKKPKIISNTKSYLNSVSTTYFGKPRLHILRKILNVSVLLLIFNAIYGQTTYEEEIDKLAKECYNGRVKSCEKLSGIALHDENANARQAAVKKINDQFVLGDIVKYDKESTVRQAAFKRITYQNVLGDIAKNGTDLSIRSEAVNRINDQRILIDIAKNNIIDTKLRITAIDKISDQSILNDLAKSDTNVYVRQNAVNKIIDQRVLSEIAKNDIAPDVRLTAVYNITDQMILAEIAKNDVAPEVRKTAVKNITDQMILAEIVKNDKNLNVRETAVRKITDQSALGVIALGDNSEAPIAAQKITDLNILLEIANNSKNPELRILAEMLIERYFQDSYNTLNAANNIPVLMYLINSKSENISKLAALKVILINNIIKKYYSNLEVTMKKEYIGTTLIFNSSSDGTQVIRAHLDYTINVTLNNHFQKFEYKGDNNKKSTGNSNDKYEGKININEICEAVLSPVSKEDLVTISQKSEVKYLREAASLMLKK
jgi:hypothetical protein